MREEHDIVLAGGQSKLGGKIFRIGHLGLVTEDEIAEVISALKVALPKAGF
jgi:aspartate aminotransferase-like enzyme